jgi:L-amino acid N-acyltransferase YncA
MNARIRIATDADLPEIVDIYNQAITLRTATADTSPITVESRRVWMQGHTPEQYPVYVAEANGSVVGWCSLSPYRPGRMALRHTAEISYYIDERHRGRGFGSGLIPHAIDDCPRLGIKTLFAIILDTNQGSTQLLEKFGFQKWGHMPKVADFDGDECGHLYYGVRIAS